MLDNHFNRREFLKTAGIGSLSVLGSALIPENIIAALQNIEPMKITRIEAVRFNPDLKIGGGSGGSGAIEWTWVRLHTDTGIMGVGETYPTPNGQIGILKDMANQIIGKDPREIDSIWRSLYHSIAMRNTGGSDMRILSALNMAQMDILGKICGVPVYQLLGGKARPKVRVYNTTTSYWAINDMQMGPDTGKIVRFLLNRGIKAMKIYPYRGNGTYISPADLENGLKWIKQIRDTAGNDMDIAVDLWGRWNLTCAMKIAHAMEPYNIMYLEDAMLMSNPQDYAILSRETSIPICMSETLATRYEYREFLESKAVDVVMYDICWAGGITEAKKISDLADTYYVPTSPHTCGGPLLWFSSIHLGTAVTNFFILESNYWKYTHQYPYFIKNIPVPENGFVSPPEGPGLGVEFRQEPFDNGDATVETIAEI